MKKKDHSLPINFQVADISILLSCSHRMTSRLAPQNNKQKYACTAQQGCGYSLAWVEYTQNGKVFQNREFNG